MNYIKIAIDFDNLYTNIFLNGSGIVLSEPTVAAVDVATNTIKAIGNDAKKLIGKTSKETKIVFPVFEGEIVNENIAVEVLKFFLNKIGIYESSTKCLALFSMPCGMGSDILEKYVYVAKKAGIKKVYFAESPILSAFGQHIPLNESTPCFIIDMSGGTTSIGAVSIDGVILGLSVNFGGNKISTDIIDYISEEYGLQIGLTTAEKIKKEMGSLDINDSYSMVVNGRDVKTGSPRSISIKSMDIYEPTKKYYDKIFEISSMILKKLSPEVSAEIRHSGIYVSGSESLIYGLKNYYENSFGIQVNVAENGFMSVALGGGIAIANAEIIKKIATNLD